MVRILGLDHLVLRCRNVETTRAWYQRHLGLAAERLEEWRAGQAPFPSLRVDATTIIDLVHGDVDGPGHVDHLCLVLSPEDLAAVRHGGELEIVAAGERFGAQGMASAIYVRDPDGLVVELRAYG
jgi:catechol 2,3-dioxygenase-like lactoylglutathione lyase family enzyme